MYWPDTQTGVDVEPARKPVASAVRKFFTEGGLGQAPTVPGGDWFNQITNEVLNVLAAAGINPSKVNDDQLLKAIRALNIEGLTLEGVLEEAPSWDAVPAYEDGGPSGEMNEQAQALANRSELLRKSFQSKAQLAAYSGPVVPVIITDLNASGVFIVDASDTTSAAVTGMIIVDALGRRWKRQREPSLHCEWFGVDTTGVTASDATLLSALQFSALAGIELVVTGKVRLTKTMLQPLHSILRCDGIIFCEDPSGLTGNLLWDVSGTDPGARTAIRSITLSTSPSTTTWVDRLMLPIRINCPRVKVGLIRTFGFQLGGPELGPDGFEISVDESTAILGAWDPAHKDVWGFNITTDDCTVGKIFTAMYPRGANVGNTSHVNVIHVWGLPANNSNQYPNRQMLTGAKIGSGSYVDYLYIDTVETETYDAVPSGNDGVAVVFAGWENNIGSMRIQNHSQTKPGKVKLARFTGYSNVIHSCLKGGSSVDIDKVNPVIYDNDDAKWRNRIDNTNMQGYVNFFNYGQTLLPNGFVTLADGYLTIEKIGHNVRINCWMNPTTVDNTVSAGFEFPLPPGLKLNGTVNAPLVQRSCIPVIDADATLQQGFVQSNGNGTKIKIGYLKQNTGQTFYYNQNQLTAGHITFDLTAPVSNQL